MIGIIRREIRAYFYSPAGYVFTAIFWLLGAAFFFLYNILAASADVTSLFGNLSYLFMLIVPLLTMRLFSEEYKQGTDKLLLTAPVSVWEIVFGKFFATMGVLLRALACTIPWLIIIAIFGTPSWPTILGCYVAVIFAISIFAAMGLFLSSLTESQLIAAVLSFALFLGLYIVDMLSYSLGTSTLLGELLSWLSIFTRYDTFMSGEFSLGNLIYFISLTGLFLYLTARVIERRRM